MSETTTAPPPAQPAVAVGPIPVTTIADNAVRAENAVLADASNTEPSWAKPAVAIYAMSLLAGAVIYAVVSKDHDVLQLTIGAIIAMATGAGNYYLGSSSSDAHKTSLLAASPPVITVRGK